MAAISSDQIVSILREEITNYDLTKMTRKWARLFA